MMNKQLQKIAPNHWQYTSVDNKRVTDIYTSYDCPPIGIRWMDWSASLEDGETTPGHEETEEQSVKNLISWGDYE